MFQDIVQLTRLTLINALEDTTIRLDMKALYDAYRAMDSAIDAMYTLEVHYLPIALESSFLQDSQHGNPFKKWYIFTEQDLQRVRSHLRTFLSNLIYVTYQNFDGELIFIMQNYGREKQIYGFFLYYYESGKLSNDGLSINFTKLLVGKKQYYEEAFISIDTHEKRVALCKEIHGSIDEMKTIRDTTKAFLLSNASLEELL